MINLRPLTGKIADLWHLVLKEAAKFGVIGAVAFVVDVGLYAFLQWGLPGPQNGILFGHKKISSVLATGTATLVSWVGNRYWTFRDKRNEDAARELALFVVFNLIGLAITLGCVVVAVDWLDLRGLAWETTARMVGIGLGTIFRFWSYRTFVFRRQLADELDELSPAPVAPTTPV